MTNHNFSRLACYLILQLILLSFSSASEDNFPDIKTSFVWVQNELYSLTDNLKMFSGFKFGEIDILIQNNSDSSIYIENFLSSLYLEKTDKHAFVFAGVENIMTDIKPHQTGSFRFKFYPKEDVPSVLYFCKVEATLVYNNEKFKQLISFDKVHVIDKPDSLLDIEHLIAYLVVFMVVAAVAYAVYKLVLKRFVKGIWKTDRQANKTVKIEEKNLKEWLPKNINLD